MDAPPPQTEPKEAYQYRRINESYNGVVAILGAALLIMDAPPSFEQN